MVRVVDSLMRSGDRAARRRDNGPTVFPLGDDALLGR